MIHSKYPLCSALGVEVRESVIMLPSGGLTGEVVYVRAAELERVLSAAPVVYGRPDTSYADWTEGQGNGDTHTARLLCIQPLRSAETAESLLREFMASDNSMRVVHAEDWMRRVCALLATPDETDAAVREYFKRERV